MEQNAADNSIEIDVSSLRQELERGHAPHSWEAAQKWFNENLGDDVSKRMKFLDGIMYSNEIIRHNADLAAQNVEAFNVLQGDIIRSSAASVPNPINPFDENESYLYIVVPTTCSAKRYKFVQLARLLEIKGDNKQGRHLIKKTLEKLNSHKYFYLPPLPQQGDDCIGNLAHFEEIASINQQLIPISDRLASMTDIGWHLFNGFLTYHYTRQAPDEKIIRGGSTFTKVNIYDARN